MTMITTDIDADFRRGAVPLAAAAVRAGSPAPSATVVDPLDADRIDDDVVVTTRRGICRVALVAAETADRFRRDGLGYDPMAWMLAPRRLFLGGAALDACLDRDACERAVLVHGLGLGLDADPAEVAALGDGADEPMDEEEAVEAERSGSRIQASAIAPLDRESSAGTAGSGVERLFTATVVSCDGSEVVQAFHASLAIDEAEIAGRLYMRMGAAAADAVIVDGVDASEPLVAALVAPAILDTLALVAANPETSLAAGLDVNVEQRFLG